MKREMGRSENVRHDTASLPASKTQMEPGDEIFRFLFSAAETIVDSDALTLRHQPRTGLATSQTHEANPYTHPTERTSPNPTGSAEENHPLDAPKDATDQDPGGLDTLRARRSQAFLAKEVPCELLPSS